MVRKVVAWALYLLAVCFALLAIGMFMTHESWNGAKLLFVMAALFVTGRSIRTGGDDSGSDGAPPPPPPTSPPSEGTSAS